MVKKSAIKTVRNRGGRPSQQDAALLKDKILDAASDLFFTHGYGATSIEAIAKQARISKRTFYTRFKDKADVFRDVMQRLVERLGAGSVATLFDGKTIEEVLHALGKLALHAALRPESMALNRLIMAESARFPELALAVNEQGARRRAIERLTGLLQKEVDEGRMKLPNPAFAAEQFLLMIVAVPQRRAMGLGKPMTPRELDVWADATVELFLNGCRG